MLRRVWETHCDGKDCTLWMTAGTMQGTPEFLAYAVRGGWTRTKLPTRDYCPRCTGKRKAACEPSG